MENERNAKEYAWKWVTGSELLCRSACDFIYAKLLAETDAANAILYDGENNLGKQIVELKTAGFWNCECAPTVPIYCRRGLYFEDIVTIKGVLVIWRPRLAKEG